MYIDWINKVIGESLKETENNFNSAPTDECRIALMLQLFDKHEHPPFYNQPDKVKNQIDSENFKNEGNRIFLSKRNAEEYLKALELYNKSIAFAPNNSTQLALGFANRSAVLFHLRKYSEAVQDIDRALKANYPVNLKHKLLLRKTECLALLGSAELSAFYHESLKWINDMSLDASNKENLINKLNAAREVIPEKLEDNLDQDVPVIVSQNEIPCATDAVALRYNKEFGRHLVATCDIKPGEVLAVEKPYAMALKTSKLYTHCAHCLKFAWVSIPCENCVHVLYCSKNCKDQAWEEYHDVECPVTGDLLNAEMNNHFFLCMRLLILAVREFGSIEQLKELIKIETCKTDPRSKGFTGDGKLQSNTYRSIYSLEANTEKRSFGQLFDISYKSVIILIALAVRTNFFDETFKQNVFANLLANEDVIFAGGLILRNLQIVRINSYAYIEKRVTGNEGCGTLILAFISLLNHDCNPNVYQVITKGRLVLYALYPLKKDTQLFNCYAVMYTGASKECRQSTLAKNYFITCKCTACEQNWPMFSELTSYDIDLIKSRVQRKRVQDIVKKLAGYLHSELWANKLSDRLKYIRSRPNLLKDVENNISVLMRSLPVNSAQVIRAMITLMKVIDAFAERFEVPELKV